VQLGNRHFLLSAEVFSVFAIVTPIGQPPNKKAVKVRCIPLRPKDFLIFHIDYPTLSSFVKQSFIKAYRRYALRLCSGRAGDGQTGLLQPDKDWLRSADWVLWALSKKSVLFYFNSLYRALICCLLDSVLELRRHLFCDDFGGFIAHLENLWTGLDTKPAGGTTIINSYLHNFFLCYSLIAKFNRSEITIAL